jgi:hypothetical protein
VVEKDQLELPDDFLIKMLIYRIGARVDEREDAFEMIFTNSGRRCCIMVQGVRIAIGRPTKSMSHIIPKFP